MKIISAASKTRKLLILLILATFCTCIDPYEPRLTEYQALLVVDGLITNSNRSYSVRLSRTFSDIKSGPALITDANVFVTDNSGNRVSLHSTSNGIYKTDSLLFTGIPGNTYTLHIVTGNEEYESDPCLLRPVPPIDSIYFEKGEETTNNGTESQKGINIYLKTTGTEDNKYYRWTYDETWKFKVPNPKKFEYVNGINPNSPVFMPVGDVKDICWKNSRSDQVIVRSMNEAQPGRIDKQPLLFIPTAKSDRLLIQYSVLAHQYSISKEEYDFWSSMKQVSETTGDIFSSQPYSVVSNIHNINNPDERVLGYFQVSAVSEKRKFITISDIATMGLPLYSYNCLTREHSPADFETRCACPPKTWDDVYWYLSIMADYTFIEPKYAGFGNDIEDLRKLVFTRPECADCELTGVHKKPDFWIDLN